jgi:hypothetical protein
MTAGAAQAFREKLEGGVVGSRDGDEMAGYDGVMFGMTAREAKAALPGLLDETCHYYEKQYPCLVRAVLVSDVWSLSQYILRDGHVWVAIGQLATIYDKSAWVEGARCRALASRLYTHLVAQYGYPDGYPDTKEMGRDIDGLDKDFPPAAPPGRIDYHYRIEAVMFTFPRGGEVKYEYIKNERDQLCQVRVIFRE